MMMGVIAGLLLVNIVLLAHAADMLQEILTILRRTPLL